MATGSTVLISFFVIFFFNCDIFYWLFQYRHIHILEKNCPLSDIGTAMGLLPHRHDLLPMYSGRGSHFRLSGQSFDCIHFRTFIRSRIPFIESGYYRRYIPLQAHSTMQKYGFMVLLSVAFC